MTDETFIIKGELHYVWPHPFVDGNSSRCGRCRYFREDLLQRQPLVKTGRCESKAHLTERGQVAPQYTFDGATCKWWFPIEKQEGENETFIY